MSKTILTLEEARAHVPGVITEDMAAFTNDFLYEHCHAIFVNKERTGYCTHCGSSFPLYQGASWKHNSKASCPECGHGCTVKHARYRHGGMKFWGYLIYYQKSAIDPEVVTAVGFVTELDLSGEYVGAKPGYIPMDMYVFLPGTGTARYSRNWHDLYYYCARENWSPSTCITSQTGYYASHGYPYARVCWSSYETAVRGTPFERAGCLEYKISDGIEQTDMAAKWPSVEYIHKLGLKQIVSDKAEGFRTYGAVYWRGKTPYRVLGLTKGDIKQIRREKLESKMDASVLYLLQNQRKKGKAVTVTECVRFRETVRGVFCEVLELLKYGDMHRIAAYVRNQMALKDERGQKRYWSAYDMQRDYMDYRTQCATLGLDETDTAVVWPKDLYRAHQNLTIQIKVRKTKAYDDAIAKRIQKLAGYRFSHGGLILRPCASGEEMVREGTELHHCVGGYVKSYAEGKTVICVLRRVSEPDKPWYTVEFSARDGHLVQCRGLRNQTGPEDEPAIKAFWAAFEAHRNKSKSKEHKLRFLVGDNHLDWHKHKICERIVVLALAPEILTFVLVYGCAAGCIDILGELASLRNCLLAIGCATRMMLFIPFFTE